MSEIATLICPIIHEIPKPDDIVIGKDNIVYSKVAISNWLRNNNTSPITKIYMTINDIRVCPVIKRICEEIYNEKKINIFRNKKINETLTIDPHYELSKLRIILEHFIFDNKYSIFGSFAYKRLINNKNMVKYYNYCKFIKNIEPNIHYNDINFHQESYESRQDLKLINDIDIFCNEGNIDDICIKLINFLPKCTFLIINNKDYKNSFFLKCNNIKTILLRMPVSTLGYIELKIDLIVKKKLEYINDNNILGVYPNIIKRIFMNSNGYYYGEMSLPIFYNIEFMNWCIDSYNKKKTITNIIKFKVFRAFNNKIECIEEIIDDIAIYIQKLYKECNIFKIDNLSIEYNISNMRIKIQIWDDNDNRIIDKFVTFNIQEFSDLINNISSKYSDILEEEIENLSYGKIKINDDEYIHICCDPDFNIDEYNCLLNICGRDQYE